MKDLLKSFVYAFSGVWLCIKTERNFRIHMVAAVVVFVFAALYGVTKTQGALLTVICALVISLEAVNTAIEAAVDLETSQKSRLAKIAKDAAAAAVLISAVGAVGSAVCIFSDLYRALAVFVTLFTPPRLIFTLIFIGAALWFIFGIKNNLKGKDN